MPVRRQIETLSKLAAAPVLSLCGSGMCCSRRQVRRHDVRVQFAAAHLHPTFVGRRLPYIVLHSERWALSCNIDVRAVYERQLDPDRTGVH